VCTLDSLIYAYGAWTIAFWMALALGLGWYFALCFFVLIGASLIGALRRLPAAPFDASSETADTPALALILIVVVLWPIALDLGRAALVASVALFVVLRAVLPLLRGGFTRDDARVFVLGTVAALAAGAYFVGWWALVALLSVVALVSILRPETSAWLISSRRRIETRCESRFESQPISAAILAALGTLIAVWFVGWPFWNPDNTYYLNKAEHYTASPISFPVRDYMYGVSGATHYPFGDILSAFEPLIGVGASLPGVTPSSLLFRLVVPLSMLLVPFAVRYAARGLGVRRANLVAGFAAGSVLLMTAANTTSLFGSASHGKSIGRVVVIPLVIGACGVLLRRRDVRSALTATFAVICAVGLSPTLAMASVVIVPAFAAAGLWEVCAMRSRGIRARAQTLVCLASPVGFLVAYSLFAQRWQRSAGSSQLIFGFSTNDPRQAWERASLSAGGTDHFLTILVIVGSIAIFPLVLTSAQLRRAAGLVVLLLFGILFAPWSFDRLVNAVPEFSAFGWRLAWALPTGLLVGLALANVDARRTVGLVTVIAAMTAIGLSGPELSGSVYEPIPVDVRRAPVVWPWDAGTPAVLQDTARALVDATPKGGRFLAPPAIEEVATAIQRERFPVYARLVYAEAVGQANGTPSAFLTEERLLLGRGMTGTPQDADAARYLEALERLEVSTVCVDERTDDGLRRAVTRTYVARGSAGRCELWSRNRT
jgi:hypothetical protein